MRQTGKRRKSPINEPEYGLLDKVNWVRGLMNVFNVVYPQLEDLDFTTQAAELEVPVYFFAGRYDVNAMASLAERYYDVLDAPDKENARMTKAHMIPFLAIACALLATLAVTPTAYNGVSAAAGPALADLPPRPTPGSLPGPAHKKALAGGWIELQVQFPATISYPRQACGPSSNGRTNGAIGTTCRDGRARWTRFRLQPV